MKLKVKVTEKSRKVDNFKKSLKQLHKQGVEVGFFAEQGIHSTSKLSYPALMEIHEDGHGVRSRPAFLITTRKLNLSPKRNKMIKKGLDNWVKAENKRDSLNILLDSIGDYIANELRGVIGNPTELAVTNNPTPLDLTGELKSKIAIRISTKSTLRS